MFIAMKIVQQGYRYRLLLMTITLLSEHVKTEKQKRQIFREQVLPALGGKIPEEAFKTDRLALNRLNKEGITVPDGIVLDARHVHKHPHSDRKMPEIIKVYLTSDGRYVSPEGQPDYNHPAKTVDTTYIIRRPFSHRTNYQTSSDNFKNIKSYLEPLIYYRQFIPIVRSVEPGIYKPIVTPLILSTNKDYWFDSSDLGMKYDWDHIVYEPFNDYFINNIALFGSHQIIEDYQGFLKEFHKRSSRHVNSNDDDAANQQHRQQSRQSSKLSPTLYRVVGSSDVTNSRRDSAYTRSIANVPKTFSRHEKKQICLSTSKQAPMIK